MSGKKFADSVKAFDRDQQFTPTEALTLAKSLAKASFDEGVDVAIRLGVDPRKADQMVRGTVALPEGTGKDVRVAVFASGEAAQEARDAGADIVGADDLAEAIQKGNMDFDLAIATPDMMPLVGRLGKVLGPRGMMPNPKIGTVTMDVATAVKGAKGGSVEFRVEKAGIVQAGVGKASFSEEKLVQNVKALADAVAKAKPAAKLPVVKKPAATAKTTSKAPAQRGPAPAQCTSSAGPFPRTIRLCAAGRHLGLHPMAQMLCQLLHLCLWTGLQRLRFHEYFSGLARLVKWHQKLNSLQTG